MTVQSELAKLATDYAKAQRRIEIKGRVLGVLPETLPAPTISNEDSKFFDAPGVWLSWRSRYRHEDQIPGSAILAALEANGFEPLPVTVCKWDSWRATPEPGDLEAIPEAKGRYTLTDVTIVAPVWLEPRQHCEPEARAYYRKEGTIYKVSVPAPRTMGITARRIETRGNWYFEHGTARLRYPEAWHAVRTADETSIAGISHLSRAYVDTEQGISGALYFELYTEQTACPLSPSQFLAALEGGQA